MIRLFTGISLLLFAAAASAENVFPYRYQTQMDTRC